MMETENQLLQATLGPPHMQQGICDSPRYNNSLHVLVILKMILKGKRKELKSDVEELLNFWDNWSLSSAA